MIKLVRFLKCGLNLTEKITPLHEATQNETDTSKTVDETPWYFGFHTNNSGYELYYESDNCTCCGSKTGGTVRIHRLAAVAWFGYDAVVDRDIHHKVPIPWLNIESNIEPLSKEVHGTITAVGNHPDDLDEVLE